MSLEKTQPYSTAEYADAYGRYLRGDSAAEGELRSLSTLGDGGGAAIVPDTLYDALIAKQCDATVLRSLAKVVPMSGNVASIAMETGGKGEEIGEGEEITSYTADVFEKASVSFKKFVCKLPVSVELLEDGAVGLEEHIADTAGRYLARMEEQAHFGPRAGFVFGINNEYLAATAAMQYDDIINSYFHLKGCYRLNASWVSPPEVLRSILIQQVRTGQKVVIADTNPVRLLGIPVYTSEYLGTYKPTDVATLFGDFSYVLLGVARDIKILVDPYTNAANDEVVYTVSMRSSATLTNTDALMRIILRA